MEVVLFAIAQVAIAVLLFLGFRAQTAIGDELVAVGNDLEQLWSAINTIEDAIAALPCQSPKKPAKKKKGA